MNKRKIFVVLFVVALGTFMSALDSSAVNIAMPVIKKDFGVSLSMVEWIITAYLLMVSTLLLTYGRIADLYGQKQVYITGLIIFTLGSLLCSLSASISMLIICRIIQALGAGMIFATGSAIITNSVPPYHRGKALSVTAITVSVALTTGPVIGGFLSTTLGWQSIFYVNVPIGIAAIILAGLNIPGEHIKKKVPFDIAGSVMIFVALLLILIPLNIVNDYNIGLPLFLGLLGLGIALFIGFIFFEKNCKYPMLNLNLFKNRVFAASNAAALFSFTAQFIIVFLNPFYLQNLRSFSAFQAGMMYIPMPLAAMIIAPFSGTFSDRFNTRYISSLGMAFVATGMFMMSLFKADTTNTTFLLTMFVTGIGIGLFQTPNNSAIMGNVPPEYRGTASGTLASMRNIGMALGVAFAGTLFSFFSKQGNSIYAAHGLTGKTLYESSFIYSLHLTFMIAGCFAIISMFASLAKGNTKKVRENLKQQS